MSPLAKRYFLLDSCIIEYFLNENIQEPLSELILNWAGKAFELSISEISYAELIDGAKKEKEEKVRQNLGKYFGFSVNKRVLSGCGVLGSIYKTQNDKLKDMGSADKIIAATSFIYNLPIITANDRDFPTPFFTSLVTSNLKYMKDGKGHYLFISVLKPNVEMVSYWYNQRK